MSPYVSRAQEKYFNANKSKIGARVVNEFNQASKGMNLPKKVGYSVNPKRPNSYKPKDITVK